MISLGSSPNPVVVRDSTEREFQDATRSCCKQFDEQIQSTISITEPAQHRTQLLTESRGYTHLFPKMTSEQDLPPPNQHRQRPTEQSQDAVDTDMPDQPSVPPPSQSATATTSLPSSAVEQEQEQRPAPPPPPVPGPRAARLQALFATTAKHTLDKINKDNFGACFPTISQKAPGTLEFVQRQMVERLGSLWNVRSLFLSLSLAGHGVSMRWEADSLG